MEDLTNQQRLELITNMIHEAKSCVVRRGSTQILLWGWVIAGANLGHFALEKASYSMPFIVWIIVIPATIYSVYLGYRMRNSGVSSHIDQVYGQVWIGIAVVIVITLLMMYDLSYYHNPIILAAAGAGMYITGRLLRYRPILLGSVVLWVAAIVEWQVALEWHYLISALAVFVGYLIPGYLLKISERG